MATAKKLGRGLDALLGKKTDSLASAIADPQPQPGEQLTTLPRNQLVPCPLQPRKNFPEEALAELADSIRAQGIIQPLIVRKGPTGKYEIIAGERRWRAAEKAGLNKLPVIIREAPDRQVLELALIENLQRSGLNPIEEARGYARLAEEFKLTQEQIAQQVGRARTSVANALRLLELDPVVQEHLATERLSTGHAKVLLSLKEKSLQRKLADTIQRDNLSVRATEKLAAQILGKPESIKQHLPQNKQSQNRRAQNERDPSDSTTLIGAAEAALRSKLGTKVAINHHKTHGKIEIEYYSMDDLNRILELLEISL